MKTKTKNNKLHGGKLNYNVSVQSQYQNSIKFLFQELAQETLVLFKKNYSMDGKDLDMPSTTPAKIRKTINELLKKYKKLFDSRGTYYAKLMINKLLKLSEINLALEFRKVNPDLTLKTNYFSGELKEYTKAVIAENVNLIKSIPDEYLSKVEKIMYRAITNSDGATNVNKSIQKLTSISKRRIELMSLDQTRKIYSKVNAYRMQKLGVKKFEWIHSGGGRDPRPSHIAMNGKIFSFDNLPIINKENLKYEPPERGLPGQTYNCGCVMGFVYDYED